MNELLDYINDSPRYRTIFTAPLTGRDHVIACEPAECAAATAWFRQNIPGTLRFLLLGNDDHPPGDQVSVEELRASPETALIVFGLRGRQKAVRLAMHGIRDFAFHTDQRYSNHKFDPAYIKKYLGRLGRIFDRLHDEESRRVFASLLKHRLTGDHGYLRISNYGQYDHPRVRPAPGDWVADCGALTGTTALRFANEAGPSGRVFAFEPDPQNFARLSSRTCNAPAGLAPITPVHHGLSDCPGQRSFAAGLSGASKISDQGGVTISVDTLDRFAQTHEISGPGLISFDIEGAEYDALRGGRGMIRSLRPRLQISLYHKKADIYRLPLWVIENYEDCQLFIGHHSPHHSETDLYVLPSRPEDQRRTEPPAHLPARTDPAIWAGLRIARGGFNPFKAERRFGCGLSPRVAPPRSVEDILGGVSHPDPVEVQFPVETFPQFFRRLVERRIQGHRRIEQTGEPGEIEARNTLLQIAQSARNDQIVWMRNTMLRRAWTGNGFRERLCFFWGDHFTALGKTGVSSRGMSTYVESAIRPHIAGRFGDLLVSAVTNPMMLQYLDQVHSGGPNSAAVLSGKSAARGLNENLAREVLELHTLGVAGPYDQSDVTELARLMTGLTMQFPMGFVYDPRLSDPGQKTVLGVRYGGGAVGQLADLTAALHVLALHPTTARHLAGKLAVHFLGDAPDDALIAHMAGRYLETGGSLSELYRALLTHPAAWGPRQDKVKPPIDFMSAALRAIAMDPDIALAQTTRQTQLHLMHPMALMGQPWEEPQGPDGWPEENAAWATPQGLAARLQWAMSVPSIYQPGLPGGEDAAVFALGPRAPKRVRRAAAAAATPWESTGLVLGSPEFQTA